MGRRPKRLDSSQPLQAFAIELRNLRNQAGSAGLPDQTCMLADISQTTYYAWLQGKQLPGRDSLERVVRAWNGNIEEWIAKRNLVEDLLIEASHNSRLDGEKVDSATKPDYSSSFNFDNSDRDVHGRQLGSVDRKIAQARKMKIAQAREILLSLGLKEERANEMSALVLLAMAGMRPAMQWDESMRLALNSREILEWIRYEYGKDYKPNTRETIRRHSLHPLIDGGLVVLNPDDPFRPLNSPKTCYQISGTVEYVLKGYGTADFASYAREWRRRFRDINEG